MQLLVWLQRVQTGLAQRVGKTGPEALTFLQQIAHAACVLLFQPLIVHVHQVIMAVAGLPAGGGEIHASMRAAMTYSADTATDEDRVEWLQLNLLLQFQTVYKSALCNTAIYQSTYSAGEQQLLAGLNQLHEIYTHLIGRFPQCCPLSEQEQAVLKRAARGLPHAEAPARCSSSCTRTPTSATASRSRSSPPQRPRSSNLRLQLWPQH